MYGLILENEISLWVESHVKRDIGQVGFMRYHSIIDYLVTLRIIVEECRNNKTNLFCCFVDFRKAFDTIHKTMPRKRLEEIMVPLELRVVVTRVYENVIAKLSPLWVG